MLVQALGLGGLLVALYALYVETSMKADEFYEPACVTRWGSCATVFKSDYAHLLSHWGLVSKNGQWDLSLATLGAMNYAVYIAYPLWRAPTLLLTLSLASCGFSIYLLYVLKVVLQDFCVVCTTFHVINFSMFAFGALPEYRRRKIFKAD
ncbi:hypothetical protein CTAYLR_001022 [Chrysophaeum taylorii]|uniref:vitamin-K-epoxide reductase (warfarin-sensitive) n=1 Tax=Chrysophaeum taylorii TaxID=2483200 RepID=A0AAD7XJN0_9STRA|nr:hypothetical protein CTAYLR_001022 [Chrysophaeum taylorii]